MEFMKKRHVEKHQQKQYIITTLLELNSPH